MKNIQLHSRKFGYFVAAVIATFSLLALPAGAVDSTTSGGSPSSSTTTTHTPKANTETPKSTNTQHTNSAANQQAHLQRIITRGNEEITRRLATLQTLSSKIAGATKLTSSDAATLNATVNSDISNLTSLKTQLDGETTVAAAEADAQSIINSYRVYALVVPQIGLIRTADDQQVTEGKIATFSTKLSSRISAAQTAGKSVSALQTLLSDLNSKVAAAQTISSHIENTVIGLVPSDYNSNHSVLSGDRSQLETAHADIQAAISDARSIVSQLQSL